MRIPCQVGNLAKGMNAMSATRLDEYDFDARLAAYNLASQADTLAALSADGMAILASQALYDLRDLDVAVRNHAARLLTSLMACLRDACGPGGFDPRTAPGEVRPASLNINP